MGKYLRKAKTRSDVAVMDFAYGVRTRAKTLALHKQQALKLHASSSSPSSVGYIQLRSRRLEKKLPPPIPSLHHDSSTRQQQTHNGPNYSQLGQQLQEEEESPVLNLHSTSWVVKDSASGQENRVGESNAEEEVGDHNNSTSKDLASFGENVLDIEGRERSTRESTPCILTRGMEDTRTPGSTTKPASPSESSRRLQNSIRRHIPTAREMDEFFGPAEEEQLRQFIEKYNFDPINGKPLPGRFQWEKLDH